MSWSSELLSHLPENHPLGAVAPEELDGVLSAAFVAAEKAHGLTLSREDYLRFIASRVPVDAASLADVQRLRLQELFLACACVHQVPGHAEALTRQVDVAVEKALASLKDSGLAAEARQLAYLRMLLPTKERGPRIASYSGLGPLASWAQVVALREAGELRARSGTERPAESDPLEQELVPNAETLYIRAESRQQFKAALHQAIGELTAQDRAVLRLHVVEALNIEEIGKLYAVHRATVARWIAASRQTLLARTQEILQKDYGVPAAELDDLVGLLTSSFDVSLGRVL